MAGTSDVSRACELRMISQGKDAALRYLFIKLSPGAYVEAE